MQQISAPDLALWLADTSRTPPVLLDVREPNEHAICQIPGALLIPMHSVPQSLDQLDADAPLVCICHHGGRSGQVAAFLQQRGFNQVINLAGGVHAWALQVDPSMATY